jgi:hypothetical protein
MKTHRYFLNHITESISINSERRPFYRKLTEGKSEAGFRYLIALELLMIPSALFWDICASHYQRNGVPFLKDELVSMNRTPEFDASKRVSPGSIPEIPWKSFQKQLKEAIASENPGEVVTCSARIIGEMKSYPDFYPMTRHLVESILRFAWFCPKRVKEAEEKGLQNPHQLIFRMMKYHLLGFWFFVQIDKAASPVHAMGVPMLTSELPDLLNDLTGD